MSVLEALWDGNIAPCEKPCRPSAEYDRLKHNLSEHYNALRGLLTGETLDHFEESWNTHFLMRGIEQREYFIDGFCLGARMMIEVLGERHSAGVR